MKTKIKSENVAHVWANWNDELAKDYSAYCESSNLHMSNDVLRSYGTDIAQRVDVKGERIYFLSENNFSVTTSKHIHLAYSAIPNRENVFPVYGLRMSDYMSFTGANKKLRVTEQIKSYVQESGRLANSATRRRDEYYKAADIRESNNLLGKARRLNKLFGCRLKVPDSIEQTAAAIAKMEKAEKAKQAKEQKARQIEAMERFESWKSGDLSYGSFHMFPVALRVIEDGETIETSRNASINSEKARLAYMLWKRSELNPGASVGGFAYVSTRNNLVKIGCHEIPVSEIEGIATLLEWEGGK
jgi:hypothetical protein